MEDDYGVTILACDAEGQIVRQPTSPSDYVPDEEQCRQMMEEARRWGEPSMLMLDSWVHLGFGLPLYVNQKHIGGLVSSGIPLEDEDSSAFSKRMHRACQGLLAVAIRENLTNEALLSQARETTRHEREKAEVLHLSKEHLASDMRQVYLLEEPALISAIRRGDRSTSREVLNRILAAIYHHGMERFELLKTYLMELIGAMARSAVEAGASGEKVWSLHLAFFNQIIDIDDDSALAPWLVDCFERLFTEIEQNIEHPNAHLLAKAKSYIEQHLAEPLSREEVARQAGFSVSHFSYLMKSYYKKSFRTLLTEMRVERAAESLRLTQKSLLQIALDCGFSDQSHFSRSFKKIMGMNPLDYRRGRES